MLLTMICAAVAAAAQKGSVVSVPTRPVLDVADILPDSVAIEGTTQGFAMHGRYAFSLHDGGMCVAIDMKRGRFVGAFRLDGYTGHATTRRSVRSVTTVARGSRCYTSRSAAAAEPATCTT